ncbi:trypsin-like peptidase domain-containing protein [Patescibacteria group bacterium]|nr:trypsin-like peptidase domain-containing protein [Patescibacteria group bacterium]
MFFKKIFSPSKPDFLKDGEEAKVIWTEKKPAPKKKTGTFFTLRFKLRPIMVMMIVSMIIGALAGGFSGYYSASYFVAEFMTTPSQLNSSSIFLQRYQEQKEFSATSGEDQAVEEIVELISPSVVNIIVTKEVSSYSSPDPFNNFFWDLPSWPDNFFGPQIPENSGPEQPQQEKKEKRQIGGGTGFVISSQKGLVLTNKHVVSDLEAEYTVTTNDGESFTATVLARDPFNDIAILQVEGLDLSAVKLGNSNQLKIGQTVIAIGNALGEYRNTVTKGVVSGISRKVIAGDAYGSSEILEDVIQTDAAINFGNSGGPLINLKGEVIGINTAINREGQLIGFAIPVNQAKRAIESVEEYGYIVRPYIGVRYILINKDIAEKNNLDIDYGALIVRGSETSELAVIPGSPANEVGLVENDIILEVDGQKITEDYSLSRIIQEHQPGDEVGLKVFHQGEEKMVNIILGEYQAD